MANDKLHCGELVQIAQSLIEPQVRPHGRRTAFYEKVTKVKADVATVLD